MSSAEKDAHVALVYLESVFKTLDTEIIDLSLNTILYKNAIAIVQQHKGVIDSTISIGMDVVADSAVDAVTKNTGMNASINNAINKTVPVVTSSCGCFGSGSGGGTTQLIG